jgi:ribosomal protein S6
MEERQDLYEITLILSPGSDLSVTEKIVAEHGEIKKTTDLGEKQFAYAIGKLTSGHYIAYEFVANTSEIKALENDIKAEKSVIRHLTTMALRKNPEPIRTGEYAKKETEPTEGTPAVAPKVEVEKPAEDLAEKIESATAEIEEPIQAEEAPEEVKIETPEEIIEEPEAETIEEPEVAEKIEEATKEITEDEPKEEKKAPAEKLISKKPRAKAEKVSADELDKKLEELVKE